MHRQDPDAGAPPNDLDGLCPRAELNHKEDGTGSRAGMPIDISNYGFLSSGMWPRKSRFGINSHMKKSTKILVGGLFVAVSFISADAAFAALGLAFGPGEMAASGVGGLLGAMRLVS